MSSASDSKVNKDIYRREELVGKQVVSSEAKIVGKVKDIALSSDGKVILQLEAADTSGPMLAASMISAVGDVILLKSSNSSVTDVVFAGNQDSKPQTPRVSPPPFPGSPSSKFCTQCGYGNSMSSRFCIKCGAPLS